MSPSALTARQWGVIYLIAGVQLVNILDFVMVMPLGPFFAAGLGVAQSELGFVAASYTASACVSGLLGSLFLDRFDRKRALAVAMVGLAVGTAAGGLAVDFTWLLVARVVAGAFGGPATSVAFSIISDTIPASHRGRAMGTVMGAFSIAAVLGVPGGLLLAEVTSWRAPFFAVGALGLVAAAVALFLLPSMTGHLARTQEPRISSGALLRRPIVRLSYALTAVVMFAGFVLIPNLASYIQLNLSFPLDQLKYAYAIGGVVSLVATQLGGRMVDRFGSFRVGAVGTVLVVSVVYVCFYRPLVQPPNWLVFFAYAGFMFSNGLRNVAYNTLTTKVPEPAVRARFQSFQSAVQHGSSSVAAYYSGHLLSKVPRPDSWPGTTPDILSGMSSVALTCMVLSALIPFLLYALERSVQAAVAARAAQAPAGATANA